MRRVLSALPVLAAVLVFSCGPRPEIVRFWDTHSIDYSDIDAAEEQFADFAELAVAAPERDARKAIDVLYNHLKADEVAYYIYSDWMESAFYNLLSPCHSPALYAKAVERIVADGVIPRGSSDPYIQKREWAGYNLQGKKATVPGVVFREKTLVLVLDKGCPTCREALTLLEEKWPDVRRVAVCCGYGPEPSVEGWEYVHQDSSNPVFDPRMTPIYFVVAADGTVEVSYTTVF